MPEEDQFRGVVRRQSIRHRVSEHALYICKVHPRWLWAKMATRPDIGMTELLWETPRSREELSCDRKFSINETQNVYEFRSTIFIANYTSHCLTRADKSHGLISAIESQIDNRSQKTTWKIDWKSREDLDGFILSGIKVNGPGRSESFTLKEYDPQPTIAVDQFDMKRLKPSKTASYVNCKVTEFYSEPDPTKVDADALRKLGKKVKKN